MKRAPTPLLQAATGQPRSRRTRAELGVAAEQIATDDLKRRGFKILARNVRLGADELDIVAAVGSTLVIAEIRMRSRRDFGGAAASVDANKQHKLRRGVERWLQAHPHAGPVRIDVGLVDAEGRLEWIENAVEGAC
ncbi:MAG: YraN family protein [Thioalkalivibrionaceae bacterium]